MHYIAPNWPEIFAHNQLHTFEDIWQLKLPTIDDGNHGRGGHSLVSRHIITAPNGQEEVLYIKRQEDYTCFSWCHLFSGMPTFEREFINWQRFRQLGLGTYDLVYFAKRQQGKHQQAILITRELRAVDLVAYLSNPNYQTSKKLRQRWQITYSIAELLRRLHAAGLQHGHLSPKHVFIGGLPDNIQSYLIDLELMRPVFWKRGRIVNDLSRFARRMRGCSLSERMRFFKYYLQVKKLSLENKRLWRSISKYVPSSSSLR